MKIETFDLLQQRRAETADTAYRQAGPQGHKDPRFLLDPDRHNELLKAWFSKLGNILGPYQAGLKLPHDAEGYNALYTSESATAQLVDEQARKLSVFVLRNRPFDMSEPLYTRAVLSDSDTTSDDLVTETPLLAITAGPSGPFAAESPLLFDEVKPTAWQSTVSELLKEIVKIN